MIDISIIAGIEIMLCGKRDIATSANPLKPKNNDINPTVNPITNPRATIYKYISGTKTIEVAQIHSKTIVLRLLIAEVLKISNGISSLLDKDLQKLSIMPKKLIIGKC